MFCAEMDSPNSINIYYPYGRRRRDVNGRARATGLTVLYKK
ncbi:hypothetical protein Q2T41_07215 [Maribacter confluentis]|uniref:Uncharacterized protein n=1 Tax=Maribacter confluentis TaxID=1656093 RepID=A0ABT8RNG8_9FLAO|nr:hypothetical protein [Maribacter confluentis]MDO1512438.1 hypothetical protein [Maribacter confluentis]